jgi:hypothetical protein
MGGKIMKTEEIINYIRVHRLSADECQSIMNALTLQPEVLTGDIVLKRTLDFLVDATCEEMGIGMKNTGKVQKEAERIFLEYLYYGIDGDTSDLMQMAADQACEKITEIEDWVPAPPFSATEKEGKR